MNDPSSGSQRRELYRIVYPLKARPRLMVAGESCPVVDLCERGIRFQYLGARGFKMGETVHGVVLFADGTSLSIEGTVMRVQGKQAVLHLGTPISHAKVLQQQRYLLMHFPGYE